MIELVAGAVGLCAVTVQSGWPTIIATAVLGWLLLLITIIDAEHFWLPDILTCPLIVIGLLTNAYLVHGIPWAQAIGGVSGFTALWISKTVYKAVRHRDGMGGGDPFLFAAGGAWLGWAALPSVLVWACLGGIVFVMAKALWRRALAMTDRIAFGPFLAFGIWVTWLCGPLTR